MGTVSLHAGILRRDHEYNGAKTSIPAETFYVEQMRSIRYGFLVPELGNNLGSASYPMQFIQSNGAVPSTAKIGADFYYDVNNSTRVRYFITCNTQDLAAALESTDAHNYVALSVASGSGYTLQG